MFSLPAAGMTTGTSTSGSGTTSRFSFYRIGNGDRGLHGRRYELQFESVDDGLDPDILKVSFHVRSVGGKMG